MVECPCCSASAPRDAGFCSVCGSPLADSATAPTSIDQGRFLPGTVLSRRYRIVGLLGRGGMGEVYRADDLKLGQPVALKFLPPGIDRDQERLNRFLSEVRTARQVTHSNVCRVYDIADVNGQHYLSMEYVDGEDLASLLRRIGRLPGDKATEIARQLCAGVQAAHDEGILHRDLKPANVMIDGRGRVKITDFGLAELEDAIAMGDRSGTPAYMAPEQIAGEEITARSDIYSLGLVLFELFTGKRAFEAVRPADPLHGDSTPARPSSHVEGLDPAVERTILHCLEEDARRRPASALAVAAGLPGGDPLAAALIAGETPPPELVAEAGKRDAARPLVAMSLAVVGLLLFVGGTRWAGTKSMLHYLPLEKRPEVLIDRAHGILDELGYTEPAYSDPVDRAWGLFRWPSVFAEVGKADSSDQRWERLRRRPDAVSFWYRQSPSRLVPYAEDGAPFLTRGPVRVMNPVPLQAGEVSIALDLAGNLRRLEVLPKRLSTREADDPDWEPLFALAGLDPARFRPDRPRYQRYHAPDSRRAWVGTREEQPEIEIRVEAGAFEGRPTLFNVATSASLEFLAEDPEPNRDPVSRVVQEMLPPFVFLAVLLSSIPLTRRNLRQGRADRRGAGRIAFVVGGTLFLAAGLKSHALYSSWWPGEIWPLLVAGVFMGVTLWSVYIAAEPIGRRVWPRMFVSLSRLLSRPKAEWRDPLIGRSVLIGTIFGAVSFAVRGPIRVLINSRWSGAPGLQGYDLDLLLGQRAALAGLLDVLTDLSESLLLVVLLVVLRTLVRRSWLAVALATILWTVVWGLGSTESLIFSLVGATISIVVLLRWGIVALLAANLAYQMAWVARTTDFSAWHAQAAIMALVLVVGLTVYGAWAATGGGRARTGAVPPPAP